MSVHRGAVALAVLVLGTVAACGPSGDQAGRVAADFYAAVGAGDGDAACALLSGAVAESLAQDAGTGCADALTSGELGDDLADRAAGVHQGQVRVAGRQAQVRLGTDTVFLARSGSTWRVTAAGCTPRPDRPYDCEVES